MSSGVQTASGRDPLGDFIGRNMPAWEQRQANYDQLVGAFGNTGGIDRSGDVMLAAGPGYNGGIALSDRDRNIARMLELANRPDAGSIESIRQPDGTYRVDIAGVGVSVPSIGKTSLPSLIPDSTLTGWNGAGGEIWSEGGNTFPVSRSSIQGVALGAVGTSSAVSDFNAGWNQPYWSVLQGPQSWGNQAGSMARNVASLTTSGQKLQWVA